MFSTYKFHAHGFREASAYTERRSWPRARLEINPHYGSDDRSVGPSGQQSLHRSERGVASAPLMSRRRRRRRRHCVDSSISLVRSRNSTRAVCSRHRRPTRARHRDARRPRGDATRMSRVSGACPRRLPRSACRGRSVGRGGLPVCSRVASFSNFHDPDTREDVTRMLRGNCFRGI